ncbi:hypothetical protein L484_021313 [Morus notabilis]|uniref:Uncharacterized protein n=1 Tax=Morus notabilis TaxID=981085 RepID=W9S887_9ROSA|nr:hypothetical protein L484_021313 [Morus notabilis]
MSAVKPSKRRSYSFLRPHRLRLRMKYKKSNNKNKNKKKLKNKEENRREGIQKTEEENEFDSRSTHQYPGESFRDYVKRIFSYNEVWNLRKRRIEVEISGEEFNLYVEQLARYEGFYLNIEGHVLRIFDEIRECSITPEVIDAAKFALDENNKSEGLRGESPLKLTRVVRVNVGIRCGLCYYITFGASNGLLFEAEVEPREDGDVAMEGEIEYVMFDGEVESEERKCDNDDEGCGAIGEEGDHRHGLFFGNLVFHVLEAGTASRIDEGFVSCQ